MSSQYWAYELHAGQARLHAHAHTSDRACVLARAHTNNSHLLLSHCNNVFAKRASVLRYAYIACLVCSCQYVLDSGVQFLNVFQISVESHSTALFVVPGLMSN